MQDEGPDKPPIQVLLAIPSPRDIPIFKEHIDRLRVSKLWVKYYRELEAYEIIQKYFLQHKQYTHLIVCPDDLLVKPEDLDWIMHDLRTYDNDDYPVISGFCNVDSKPENNGKINITTVDNLPHVRPIGRRYIWMSTTDREIIDGKLFPVGYTGFALIAMNRPIIERIVFRNDGNCCLDVMFCWDCAHANPPIPIYVDPKINLVHLKKEDGIYEYYNMGREPFAYIQEIT